MRAILVDAGPLIALLDRSDRHHAAVVAASREIREPRLTVWPAVTEAMYLLASAGLPTDGLWRMIESKALELAPLDASDAQRMRELMAKYADRPMDLADAALVRVAEREDIIRVFTLDRADFQAYRRNGKHSFELIP